jgi:NAD(P)H-hydrate epimerase
MAIPLLHAKQMQELDRATIEDIGIPGPVLMEIAGRACAEVVEDLLPTHRAAKVAVLCGKGNNGGDGFVAARHLHNSGARVDVFLFAQPEKLSKDAELNMNILKKLDKDIRVVPDQDALNRIDLEYYDVVLDALLGTGLESNVRGLLAAVVDKINTSEIPVVAVDIPTGLSADTGMPLGQAVIANHTVTFAFPKPGHVVYPGASLSGDLTVVDIGIPPQLAPQGPESSWLFVEEDAAVFLGRRADASHKGDFGHLLVVAGSPDKPGAAGLCCQAAIRSGAGLVSLAASKKVVRRIVSGPVEYMGHQIEDYKDLKKAAQDKQALAIGPGIGTDKDAAELVQKAVAELEIPMVIDADGLNNLVGKLDLIKNSPAERVLTPHPGEMARLLGITSAEVQADRLNMARNLATDLGCVVVLKGAGTIVADSRGTLFVMPCGNPGMASGGTGDVLTGMIGALLAQGFDGLEAANIGAYVHGCAGDLAMEVKGQRAMVASDLISFLPSVFHRFESFLDEDDDEDGYEQDQDNHLFT